ncbi:MAG: hypothetical protein U0136_04765 [Bdellovibrionota bacterium]
MATQVLSKRARRVVDVDLGTLVENANAQYYCYLQWQNTYFARRHGFYRIAIFGAAELPPDHPALKWAYELGERLAQLGIDIVVRAGSERSIGYQAAAGHRAGHRTDPQAKRKSTPRCINVGTSALNEPRGRSERLFDESIPTSNHFDWMGGLGSDFVSFEGGPNVAEATAGVVQRIQFQGKIPPDQVPLGLRLGSTVTRIHWVPRIICVGGAEEWRYMRTACETFAQLGTVSVERKEHELVQFMPKVDDVVRWAKERRRAWDEHKTARRVPEIESFEALQRQVSRKHIAKTARQQGLLFEGLAESCIAPSDLYYCAAAYGAHHLPEDHPHMLAASVLGKGSAAMNMWAMDGSGGLDSVMGRHALGFIEERARLDAICLCLGNSIGLPWERPADIDRDFVFSNWGGLFVRFAWFNSWAKEVRALLGGWGSALELTSRIKLGVNRIRAGSENPDVFGRFGSLSDRLGWIPPVTMIGSDPIWSYMKQAMQTWRDRGHIGPHEHGFVQFVGSPEEALALSSDYRRNWVQLLDRNGYTARN